MIFANLLVRRRLIQVVVFVIVLAGILWYWSTGSDDSARYRTAEVETGDVRVAISATGALRALSTVEIGSQISGQVISVEVDFNDPVKAGQAIAHIDPAPLRTRLTQAEANLASARAGLVEARAALRNAEADFTRKTELASRSLVSGADVDLALAARDQARARIASAQASVQQAEAAVASARLDLDYTVIRSPVDGVVLERAVQPGQTVAASFQTPKLFQIVEDLSKMQIDLSVDESDVGQIAEGQRVEFTVDAFPNERFVGVVHQVRMAATNVQNVITYPVVVGVENPDRALLPGMTANAEIEVGRRSGVIRVPNQALRFRPPDAPPPERTGGLGAGMRIEIGEDVKALVERLDLTPDQRELYERVQRSRQQAGGQRPATLPPAAAAMAAAAGGNTMIFTTSSGSSPEAIKRMVGKRLLESYSEFRAGLDPAQRQRFEHEFMALFEARNASLWVLEDGRPVERKVRLGLSDATHTEVLGDALRPGDAVVLAVEVASE